jgi:diguanylate cyclase (GGDEF)-like protein/PAS domain S-box-containing protein
MRGRSSQHPDTHDDRQARVETPAEAQLRLAEALAEFGRWSFSTRRGLWLSEGAGRIIAAIGFASTAPMGPRTLLRALTAGSRREVLAALRRALAGEAPDPVELVSIRHNRSSRSVSTVWMQPAEEAGEVWGVARDISENVALRSALDQSESRWEMALVGARQGVWDSDIDAGVVYHSRTWRTMRGLDPDGPLADLHDDWLDRIHPGDRDRILHQIDHQHAGEEQRVAMEYRERMADGRYLWISSLGAPVDWYPDGRPRRIVGTDTDITDRKQAEEELADLSRRLELALKVSSIGVFEANLETGEVFWDERVREIFGRSLDGPIGPTEWDEALHPDDFARMQRVLLDAVELHQSYQTDFRIVRADGAVRTVRTNGVWYRNSHGVALVLGTNLDVTEEVNAKRDLERAKELAEARNLELEQTRARIEHNALHDILTGLPNRRYLDQVLGEQAQACRENGGTVGLLHIDLDRFKQINDTLGHVAGDAMLIHAAALLRSNLAPGDFVARVGGDEFIVVCSLEGHTSRLANLASAIVHQMRQPVPYEGHFCRFGASIGIAIQHGSEVDAARLLIDADIALYRAKGRGKNGFEFFSKALQAETVRTKRVADDILRGIDDNEFLPYYQPMYDARTLGLVGVEALARWQHPIEGTLLPGRFLKVAEDLNVVNAIDRIILEKALADYRRWTASGYEVPGISVNVSFRRLLDEQLIENLETLDIPPGVVSFELLESIFLDDVEEMVTWNLDRIRELGIDISIDDFGTGHASIISLLKLRPGRLKIDRQFIDSLVVSDAQKRLVRSLIDIGKSLDIRVVAEGVESSEQAEILASLGCDILQGYALARPMSAAALEAVLLKHRRQAS